MIHQKQNEDNDAIQNNTFTNQFDGTIQTTRCSPLCFIHRKNSAQGGELINRLASSSAHKRKNKHTFIKKKRDTPIRYRVNRIFHTFPPTHGRSLICTHSHAYELQTYQRRALQVSDRAASRMQVQSRLLAAAREGAFLCRLTLSKNR